MIYTNKLYKTNELTDELIKKILIFKDSFWTFGFNSQKVWFKENIKNNYIHSIMFDKDENIVGYGVRRVFENYNILDSILVSEKHRKKSIGSKIVKSLTESINCPILLLCEKKNISFYEKNSFRESHEIIFKDKEKGNLVTMSINYEYKKKNDFYYF